MKRLLAFLCVLTIATITLMSCDTSLATGDLNIEDQVWETNEQSLTGGVTMTLPFPIVMTADFDGDLTDETTTTSMYIYLSGGTSNTYEVTSITDGGTDTTTLAAAAGTAKSTGSYTLIGNTITVDGDAYELALSGDILTLNQLDIIDLDDLDGDSNTTETYTATMISTKVTTPTFAQLEADSFK